MVFLGTITLNIWLYRHPTKTFFPERDTGVLMGGIQADQASFEAMRGGCAGFYENYSRRSAVNNVTGFTGGSRVNGMMFYYAETRAAASKRRSKSLIDCGSNWQGAPTPAVF